MVWQFSCMTFIFWQPIIEVFSSLDVVKVIFEFVFINYVGWQYFNCFYLNLHSSFGWRYNYSTKYLNCSLIYENFLGLTWLLVYRTEKYQKLKGEVEKQSKKCKYSKTFYVTCSNFIVLLASVCYFKQFYLGYKEFSL